MRIRHGIIVMCAALLLIPAGHARAGVGEQLLTGVEAMYRGQWEVAAEHFSRAMSADATCAEAMVGHAAALLQMGRTDEAAEQMARATVAAPEMAAAYAGIGACRYLQGDTQQAMLDYRRALSYTTANRASLQASVAWLACRLGLYTSALTDAEAALAAAPDDPLARHVYGAAMVALGRHDEALKALGRQINGTPTAPPGVLAVPSALLSPEAQYWAEHDLDARERLAAAPPAVPWDDDAQVALQDPEATGEPTPQPPAGTSVTEGFSILRPAAGSAVSGLIEVTIEADRELGVEHIVVMLDNSFVAMSNVRPFRATVDSRRANDGVRELRVEGYSRDGHVRSRAIVQINVANADRTLAPEERAARRTARDELCRLLSLQATPLTNSQLLGRALEEAGRREDAIAAYEYAFSHDPLLPGLRAELMLSYRAMGLRPGQQSREIYTLSETGAVALTFDDGPHPVMTPWILELLDRYNYRATFFLIGKQSTMYPELVRMIADRGHEIGSHSHTHVNMTTLDSLGAEQELVRSRAAIRQACGRIVTLFRPPGGNYDDTVRRATVSTGFTSVFWTENIGNYPGAGGPEIAAAMDRRLADGGIVLLHNGYDETQVALPHLLKRLHARGVRCDTISALTDDEYAAGVRTTDEGPDVR